MKTNSSVRPNVNKPITSYLEGKDRIYCVNSGSLTQLFFFQNISLFAYKWIHLLHKDKYFHAEWKVNTVVEFSLFDELCCMGGIWRLMGKQGE